MPHGREVGKLFLETFEPRCGSIGVMVALFAALLAGTVLGGFLFRGYGGERSALMSSLEETVGDLSGTSADEPVFVVSLDGERLTDDKNTFEEIGTAGDGGDSAEHSMPDEMFARVSSSREAAKPAAPAKKSSSTTVVQSVAAPLPSLCSFSSSLNASYDVFVNEIAWMGGDESASDEWIELKNNSSGTRSLRGWRLMSEDENIEVVFPETAAIVANGLFLLERTDDNSVSAPADLIYQGALSNSGARLKLFDDHCALADEVNASEGWNVIGGENNSKKTAERNAGDFLWHTSAVSGGTPRAKNSESVAVQASTAPATTTPRSDAKYMFTVSLDGNGAGRVDSVPAGIACGVDCYEEFFDGTSLAFTATPFEGSRFDGWSGACTGASTTCAFVVNAAASLRALFSLINPPPSSGGGISGGTAPSSGGIKISEIMAGSSASAEDEFIELYNTGTSAIDLTGWSIKKKTSSGTEYSLIVASRLEGKVIPGGRYFLAVNEGGYAGSVPSDATWAQSNTLAYTNNAIVLYDTNGAVVEEVSWADIPKDQSYERQGWDASVFSLQPNPTPRNSSN